MRISEEISVHLGYVLYRSVKVDKSVIMDGMRMVDNFMNGRSSVCRVQPEHCEQVKELLQLQKTGIEAYDNDEIISLLVNKGFLVVETVDEKQRRESIYG